MTGIRYVVTSAKPKLAKMKDFIYRILVMFKHARVLYARRELERYLRVYGARVYELPSARISGSRLITRD
jgi:hypothetical protein